MKSIDCLGPLRELLVWSLVLLVGVVLAVVSLFLVVPICLIGSLFSDED